MNLAINNKTLTYADTIIMALLLPISFQNPSFPHPLWIVIGYLSIYWLVSRPMFAFEYLISINWIVILLTVTGLLIMSTGYQAFNPPNLNIMQAGLYLLGIGAMLGIRTYFDTNMWVKVESTMAIIGLVLLLLSKHPALADNAIITQFGIVLFAVGVSILILTYTKRG